MAKHPKRPRDPNQLAKLVVDIASGQKDEARSEQNSMAELGRVGGLKGGTARAKKLTPEQRTEIAKKAASVRWGASPAHAEEE